jgi:hypothetical protein
MKLSCVRVCGPCTGTRLLSSKQLGRLFPKRGYDYALLFSALYKKDTFPPPTPLYVTLTLSCPLRCSVLLKPFYTGAVPVRPGQSRVSLLPT